MYALGMKIIRRFYAVWDTRKTIKSAVVLGLTYVGILGALALSQSPSKAHAASILLTDMQPTNLTLSAEQTKWLKNKRILRVVTKADWRPIEVTSASGAFTGISGDYLRILTTKLGLSVEITQYASNAAAIAALNSGKADICHRLPKPQSA